MFITANPITAVETAFAAVARALKTRIAEVYGQSRDGMVKIVEAGAETDTKPFEGLL